MNETIVYYSYSTKGIVSGKEPSKAIKEFLGDNVPFLKCPVYRDAMKNVFSVGSWFNLKLNVDEKLFSFDYNSETFKSFDSDIQKILI